LLDPLALGWFGLPSLKLGPTVAGAEKGYRADGRGLRPRSAPPPRGPRSQGGRCVSRARRRSRSGRRPSGRGRIETYKPNVNRCTCSCFPWPSGRRRV